MHRVAKSISSRVQASLLLLGLAGTAGATGPTHASAATDVSLAELPSTARVRPENPNETPHQAEVALLADRASVRPGEPFRLGVRLSPDPGWHAYWHSPGDIGMPLTFQWNLPEHTLRTPRPFPTPERFETSGIVSYGYDEPVLLFSDVTLPEDTPHGLLRLDAHAEWLVCENVCVPGSADLSLPIEVSDAEVQPTPWTDLFDRVEARHPTPLSEVDTFAVESALSQSAYRPGDPFEAIFRVTPTSVPPADLTPDLGVWPTFVPIADNYQIYVYDTSHFTTEDGSLVVHLKGDALELEELPETSKIGGLVQVRQGARWTRAEYVIDVPWVPAGTAIEHSASPLWDLTPPEVPTAPPGPPEASRPSSPTPGTVTGPAPRSMVTMLAFAFLGGMLLNVMPCVFPVITLKAFGLVRHAERGAAHQRRAGLAYTAGVVASFWALALGVLLLKASAGGIGWGFQFQSPLYVAALTTIVLVFSLSLFGVYEIPALGTTAAAKNSEHSGIAGDFLNGVFATLVATPCTAPFMGAAIGFAFSQSTPVIALFFTVIGLGMAMPFLAIAFIPSAYRFLPRPGPWMETFKQLMGFTLVATSVWLTSILVDLVGIDHTIGFLWFLVVVSVGAWVYGRWGGVHETSARRSIALLVALGIAAIGGNRFLDFTQPAEARCDDPTAEDLTWENEHIPWLPFTEQRVTDLSGRPMFIDFTASWCLTCKVNERTVLETPEVREAMERLGIVPLVADWTRRDPVITEWLQRYGRAGVPFYLVIPAEPDQDPIPLPEVLTTSTVVSALEAASGSGT